MFRILPVNYNIYVFVFNSISHSFAAFTREISSEHSIEDKIHIHARECNILYIRYHRFPEIKCLYSDEIRPSSLTSYMKPSARSKLHSIRPNFLRQFQNSYQSTLIAWKCYSSVFRQVQRYFSPLHLRDQHVGTV